MPETLSRLSLLPCPQFSAIEQLPGIARFLCRILPFLHPRERRRTEVNPGESFVLETFPAYDVQLVTVRQSPATGNDFIVESLTIDGEEQLVRDVPLAVLGHQGMSVFPWCPANKAIRIKARNIGPSASPFVVAYYVRRRSS